VEVTQHRVSAPTGSKNRDTKQSIWSVLRKSHESAFGHSVTGYRTCCGASEAQQEMRFLSRELRNEQKGCGGLEDASPMQRAAEVRA